MNRLHAFQLGSYPGLIGFHFHAVRVLEGLGDLEGALLHRVHDHVDGLRDRGPEVVSLVLFVENVLEHVGLRAPPRPHVFDEYVGWAAEIERQIADQVVVDGVVGEPGGGASGAGDGGGDRGGSNAGGGGSGAGDGGSDAGGGGSGAGVGDGGAGLAPPAVLRSTHLLGRRYAAVVRTVNLALFVDDLLEVAPEHPVLQRHRGALAQGREDAIAKFEASARAPELPARTAELAQELARLVQRGGDPGELLRELTGERREALEESLLEAPPAAG